MRLVPGDTELTSQIARLLMTRGGLDAVASGQLEGPELIRDLGYTIARQGRKKIDPLATLGATRGTKWAGLRCIWACRVRVYCRHHTEAA